MSLFIYNTLSGQKEKFISLSHQKVKMYVCGPTLYGFLHIGNFRGLVFFNFVRNWLEKNGYDVNFVYNYTDVDDKIIQKAKEEQMSFKDLTNKYIKIFEEDFQCLKIKKPSHTPRVTQYIRDIVDFISDLVEKKKAYEKNGSVYYSVKDFSDYGVLSHKDLSQLMGGEKSEGLEDKRSPFDFALWKRSKNTEPSWDSPWGEGRPGWHIECSTMIRSLLGESIDIHGGGIDLVFPHHENEKAQTEALTGKTFVRYWMHHNMIEFQDQKMSKSLGNVQNMRNFLKDYNAEIFKYLIFSVHYRSVLNFSSVSIQKALQSLSRIYSALSYAEKKKAKEKEFLDFKPSKNQAEKIKRTSYESEKLFSEYLKKVDQRIEQVINDDFNTPEMIARIFEVVRLYNFLCRGAFSSKHSSQKREVAFWTKSLLKEEGEGEGEKDKGKKEEGEKKEEEEDKEKNPKDFPRKGWQKVFSSLSESEQKKLSEVFCFWIKKWGKGMSLFQEPSQVFLMHLDDLLLKKRGLKREDINKMVQKRTELRKKKDFKKADALRSHLVSLGISLQDLSEGESLWEVSKHFNEGL